MKKLNNKGFSLVELIIVIAIMVVLVGVLAPQFIKYVESSRQSTDMQNAAELRSVIEALVADGTVNADVIVEMDGKHIKVKSGATAAQLTAMGATDDVACKSQKWPDAKGTSALATYSVTNYKWTTNSCVAGTNDIAKSFQ